jgi:hypothetical protein
MSKATHKFVNILLVLQGDEESEPEYAVFSGLISQHESDLLDIFQSSPLWAPRNIEVDAYRSLLSYFSAKVEIDRWYPGNPVDETYLADVVPKEMKKMLKAMKRKYIRETYQYEIIANAIDGYSLAESMDNYIEYLQKTIEKSPGLIKRSWELTIEQLPTLLGMKKKKYVRDASPERDKIIKSSSQDSES